MTDTDIQNGRLADLDNEVRELKADVSGLSGRVDGLHEQNSQIIKRLDTLSSALGDVRTSAGPTWGGVVGVAMTILGLLLTGALGISNYVDLFVSPQIDHITSRVDHNEDDLDTYWEFRAQMHHEVGRFMEVQRVNEEKLDHFDKLDHVRDDRISELEKRSAASEISRRAIGDYARELSDRAWGLKE